MIKKLAQWTLLSTLLLSGAAYAEMKIVVLDSVRAILESEDAKVLAEAANKEMEAEQTELRTLVEEMQALNAKLQKDGDVMSDAEKRDIQKDIEDMQIEAQFDQQKLQKRVQDKRQEILQKLAPKFDAVLKNIIAVEQIDLIMAPNALQYANSKHDITPKVTEQLNEKRD